MKYLVMFLAAVVLFSCSTDDGPAISQDEQLLFATTFQAVSIASGAGLPGGDGGADRPAEPISFVLRFREGGKMERFIVDADHQTIGTVVYGRYKLDYPRIYDISMYGDSETVVSKRSNNTLMLVLDDLVFQTTAAQFDQ